MATVKKYQNNFTTGVISPAVAARVDLDKYSSALLTGINGVIHAHGGFSKRPGTRYVDELPGSGLLLPFVYSVEQAYVLVFLDHKMRVCKDGGAVMNPGTGQAVEIDTPYSLAEIPKLKFTQSADILFLTHPAHRPMKLTRMDHHLWEFEEIKFFPPLAAPENLKAEASGFKDPSNMYRETTADYKVSAVNDREIESMPSEAVTADTLSTWPSGAQVKLTWNAVPEAVRYEVYKDERGYYAWLGSADTNEFTDNNIAGNSGTGPKENRDPFAEPGDYPGTVGIFQQRLFFGRTNNQPHTIWASEIGAFDSMAVAHPLRDDSAITATVDSKQMNEIRHFVALKGLLVLTSGAEFKMYSKENNNAITPTSIGFEPQSYWGSSDVPPVVAGDSILIVQNSGEATRDLFYQFTEDGYVGEEVSLLAEHLMQSPVTDWAFQQSPWSCVWVCLENGKLLTFTYRRDHQVWAWAEQESAGGKFRSVCVIREGREDNCYFLVERDGKFFIECQVRRHYGDRIEDAFFVDCGLSYDGEPTERITGLHHLVGKDIVVLADGSVLRDRVIEEDGSMELRTRASRVRVGLPYEMVAETVDPEIRSDEGSLIGETKNAFRATFMLRETAGLEAGPSADNLVRVKFPQPDYYNAPPKLYTGPLSVALPGANRREASIVFRQSDPLPATVLSVVTMVSIG